MYTFFKVNTQEQARIIGFDLLRCLAIFFVLRGHAADILNGTRWEGFPWFRTPHGVDVFLVITGFFIGGKFLKSFEKNDWWEKKKSLKNFFRNTIFRILPNYYLMLLVNYICIQQGIILGNTEQFSIFLFLTFTQNLWYAFYGFYWESWSLATQMFFYIAYPLITFWGSIKWNIKHLVLGLSLSVIGASLGYRWLHHAPEMDYFYWDVWIRKVVISRLDCIFIGVLMAWFKRYYLAYWTKYTLHLFALGCLMYLGNILFIPVDVTSLYTQVFYLTISAIYIALWFPMVERIRIEKTWIRNGIFLISTLSYAMYLTNLLLKQILDTKFPTLLAEHATAKYLLFYLLTFVASYFLYIFFEKPMYLLGKKLSK